MNAFDIVVPCKGLTAGKSRLSDVLTPREREKLCRRLLTRTVRVAIEAAGRDRVTVVSGDEEVRAIGVRLGAAALDDGGRGLNEALAFANMQGADAAAGDPASRRGLIVLPIDLPLVTAGLLRDAAARTQGVGIAPDAAGTGTNLLVLAPQARRDFPFAYGPDSFRLHREAALARGAEVARLSHTGLAFDLDRPADLSALRLRRDG